MLGSGTGMDRNILFWCGTGCCLGFVWVFGLGTGCLGYCLGWVPVPGWTGTFFFELGNP